MCLVFFYLWWPFRNELLYISALRICCLNRNAFLFLLAVRKVYSQRYPFSSSINVQLGTTPQNLYCLRHFLLPIWNSSCLHQSDWAVGEKKKLHKWTLRLSLTTESYCFYSTDHAFLHIIFILNLKPHTYKHTLPYCELTRILMTSHNMTV